MAKPKVFVTRLIPEAGMQRIVDFCDAEVWTEELPPAYDVLLQKCAGKDGVLTLLTDKIDPHFMDATGRQLKVISQYAVGFDNIDIPAATGRGIPVGHTPGVLTETTADFAWTLLMAAARRVVEGDNYTRAGKWKTWGPKLLLGQEVFGSTLGIVGFGRIGQAVARRAMGFQMRIIYYDLVRNPEAEKTYHATYVSMDEMLEQADFISLHTVLSKETFHLISTEQFKKMKPTAILVNTSRGPVIDEAALYEALKTGQIACAGLDVCEKEPIPQDSPLLSLQNVIIAPHIASASVQTRDKMAVMAAENLLAGLRGEKIPYCANPQVYDGK